MTKTVVFLISLLSLQAYFSKDIMAQQFGGEEVCHDEFGEPWISYNGCNDAACISVCNSCGSPLYCDSQCNCNSCTYSACSSNNTTCICSLCGQHYNCNNVHTCSSGGGNNNGGISGGYPGSGGGGGGNSNPPPLTVDCLGVWGGTAFYDNCGQCVGGTSSRVPCSARLGSVSSSIQLMEDFDLEVIISNANTVNVNSITFKIGKNGSWWDLQYGASIYCNIPARKPGYYKLKASVNFDSGKCLETTEKNIEVTFPDVSEIQSDATVSEAMNTVWAQTKSAASPSGRSERRFWIYANTTGSNLTFETDTYDTGPINTSCEPGTGSSVSAGNPIDTQGTPTAGGRYYVALFHTHTPLTYCSSSAARPTGPSENDNLYVSTGGGLPGLVYDYNATIIQGGHNINAPSRIYIFGSNKRRTPYF